MSVAFFPIIDFLLVASFFIYAYAFFKENLRINLILCSVNGTLRSLCRGFPELSYKLKAHFNFNFDRNSCAI